MKRWTKWTRSARLGVVLALLVAVMVVAPLVSARVVDERAGAAGLIDPATRVGYLPRPTATPDASYPKATPTWDASHPKATATATPDAGLPKATATPVASAPKK